MTRRRRILQLAALGLALVGYWLPWLTQPAAALRLNGYELSEWVTYLPGVRDGSLPLSRVLFLLPLACLALLLALAAARGPDTSAAHVLGRGVRIPGPGSRPRTGLGAMLPVAGPGGRRSWPLGSPAPWWSSPPIPMC